MDEEHHGNILLERSGGYLVVKLGPVVRDLVNERLVVEHVEDEDRGSDAPNTQRSNTEMI